MNLVGPTRSHRTSVLACSVVTASLLLVAPVPAHAAPGFTVSRPADTTDRFATAASVARAAFPDGAPEVVLVNGDDPVDALGAAAFAGTDTPILYVHRDSVPAATAAVIAEFEPEVVSVAGGESAVSQAVVAELGAGREVHRFTGENRYATAAALAVAGAAGTSPERVLLARGDVYADALAAAAWAAKDGSPILLTAPGTLSPNAAWALERLDPAEVVVIGGVEAVSTAVTDRIAATGATTVRIRGTDRYDTAALIADEPAAGFTRTAVGLASGATLVDALPASVLLAQSGSPLLLTRPDTLGAAAEGYLLRNDGTLTSAVAVGGPGAIPDSVLEQVRAAATPVVSAP